jgi:hypothetical protein
LAVATQATTLRPDTELVAFARETYVAVAVKVSSTLLTAFAVETSSSVRGSWLTAEVALAVEVSVSEREKVTAEVTLALPTRVAE